MNSCDGVLVQTLTCYLTPEVDGWKEIVMPHASWLLKQIKQADVCSCVC